MARRLWFNQNLVHHAEIFMQQDMAVKQRDASRGRIAEIHSNFHAVIRSGTFPERHFNGVAHVRVLDRLTINFQHLKMNLMQVEGMGFESAIFDRPVFDSAYFGCDGRFLIGFEYALLLSVDGEEELDGAVSAGK